MVVVLNYKKITQPEMEGHKMNPPKNHILGIGNICMFMMKTYTYSKVILCFLRDNQRSVVSDNHSLLNTSSILLIYSSSHGGDGYHITSAQTKNCVTFIDYSVLISKKHILEENIRSRYSKNG